VAGSAIADGRYIVISADGHAGADLVDYRPYLERRWHDDFDAWAATFHNPFADLRAETRYRNWDSERRTKELDADGVTAEVLFPNTIPPFFEGSNLMLPPPTAENLEQRWAGLRAHNRWMADFCADLPGRRAGTVQVFLNDVDAAVAEIRWGKEHGLFGGVLVPGVPPDAGIPGLYAEVYEPIWAVCDELDVPINNHSGSAAPDYGTDPAARPVLLTELGWFSHRSFWHLLYAGVFERHPNLKLVLTEQSGCSWVPGVLRHLEELCTRLRTPGSSESLFGGDVVAQLSLTPTEYWQRNCYVGASFMQRADAEVRHEVGVDRILWGADYPHVEGTWPFTTESFRHTYAGVPTDEIARMVGGNAAEVYGFDLDALAPIAAEIGPRVGDVAIPLDDLPDAPLSRAFIEPSIVKPW
jgi:predicted TIM-barrel fold metal-dependent hydrolase